MGSRPNAGAWLAWGAGGAGRVPAPPFDPDRLAAATTDGGDVRSPSRRGFALHHFDRNGLVLPACEPAALRSGHALHRGPHQGYSDVVAARVERIRAHFAVQAAADLRGARRTAVMRLRLLQDTTRRALTDRHRGGFWLNRRDPMRLFVDRPYLDEAIERLFGG